MILEEGIIFDDIGKVIDISGSSFFIKDSRIKPSPAEIQINANGALNSMSEVLNKPPLKLFDRVQQPVNFGNAQVSGKGRVELPLKSNLTSDEIKMFINADDDVCKLEYKITYLTTMLNYIESILKVIQNRTYQIKNAIEFMRFQSGLG